MKRQYPRALIWREDFEVGFVDGYSDFSDNGGKVICPPASVEISQGEISELEGHARIKDYFLGFKYGMDIAIATGCRPFYTYPILVPESNDLRRSISPFYRAARREFCRCPNCAPLPLPRDARPMEKLDVPPATGLLAIPWP